MNTPDGPLRMIAVAIGLTALAAAVLVLAIRLTPEGAWSADIYSWLLVADVMQRGVNPYTTGRLNWPPMWMQVIFWLSSLSQVTGLRLVRWIQLLLIGVHATAVVTTYLLLRTHWRCQHAWRPVVAVLVVGPVAILLTAVHGNFDVFVGLLALLAVWALTRWLRKGRIEDWLWACLLIGLGALVKTVPIVLAPLLLVGWRRLTPSTALLGTLLVAGPISLGMGVILALAPEAVMQNVIGYHSLGGSFGLSGLIHAAGWPLSDRLQAAGFVSIALGVGALIAQAALRDRLVEGQVVTVAAALLLGIPLLGPGFGMQYAWWVLPLGVVVYALSTTLVRAALLTLYAVATVTYAVGYAFISYLGALALHWQHPASWDIWARAITEPSVSTYLLMPLWLAGLLVLVVLGWQVAASRPPAVSDHRPGPGPAAVSRNEADRQPQVPSRMDVR